MSTLGALRRSAVVALLVASSLGSAAAQDARSALRQLSSSDDFRVRVTAALLVGRDRPPGARDALVQSLSDAHPAVRIAAADALGTLNDPEAVGPLEQRFAAEGSANVRARIAASLDKLRRSAPAVASRRWGDVRCVVVLGAVRNPSGVRSDELKKVLEQGARARVQSLPGVVLAEQGGQLLHEAASKHVPVVVLDGSLTVLSETRSAGSLQIRAVVEFTVRREQTLKGTVSGAATTYGSGPTISEAGRRTLQEEAVSGAVESALHGADQGLIVAAR